MARPDRDPRACRPRSDEVSSIDTIEVELEAPDSEYRYLREDDLLPRCILDGDISATCADNRDCWPSKPEVTAFCLCRDDSLLSKMNVEYLDVTGPLACDLDVSNAWLPTGIMHAAMEAKVCRSE